MYVLDIFHMYMRRYSRNFDADYYFYLKLIISLNDKISWLEAERS